MGAMQSSGRMRGGIPLQEWISAQYIRDEMRWKRGSEHQALFIRDTLQGIIGSGLTYYQRQQAPIARVISTHMSKSIVLPVVAFDRPDLGLRIVVRNNFYDWKISVITEEPLVADFECLFFTMPPPEGRSDMMSSCYFEGFPEELVFGYYGTSDGRSWSAEVSNSDWRIASVFHAIMRSLGAVQPLRWKTREQFTESLSFDSLEDVLLNREEWSPMKQVGML